MIQVRPESKHRFETPPFCGIMDPLAGHGLGLFEIIDGDDWGRLGIPVEFDGKLVPVPATAEKYNVSFLENVCG